MAKIIGNPTVTPMAVPDWNQTDSTKADFIKNKPTVLTEEEILELIIEDPEVVTVMASSDDIIKKCFIKKNGAPLDSENFICTKYIPVDFDDDCVAVIKCTVYSYASVVFYDSNKRVILGIDKTNAEDYGITCVSSLQEIAIVLPRGTSYVRMSAFVSGNQDNFDPANLWIKGQKTTSNNFVRYIEQSLTEKQKAQARYNIGAAQDQLLAIPDYWEEHLAQKILTIKTLQDFGGKDCFSFVVLADTHYPQNLGKISPVLARRILDECDIRFALDLGDSQSRGCHRTKELLLEENESIEAMFAPIRDRLLETEGNHDGAYGEKDRDGDGVISNYVEGKLKPIEERETYVTNFTPGELYSAMYRKVGLVGDVHFDESGSGYYIDDVSNRVRYIILNTQNAKYELNDDGTTKFPKMWTFRFTQSQFNLVIEALKGVPSESWGVVIAGHSPLHSEIGDREVMQGVLRAYKDKTEYSGSYDGTDVGKKYSNLADPTSEDWLDGYRITASGTEAREGSTTSNFIHCAIGDVVRVKGASFRNGQDRYGVVASSGRFYSNGVGYVSAGSTEFVSVNKVDDVYEFTILHTGSIEAIGMRFAFATPGNSSDIIITVNEPIIDIAHGYDYVEVETDFTEAKGELIGYFGGHVHKDTLNTDCGFNIITVRSDAKEENEAELKAERIKGTTTEQSFDVFTVNKATRTIHATKIGAGFDRTIVY